MNKPLSISQAWRFIAAAFNKYEIHAYPYYENNGIAECGLCYATVQLMESGRISAGQRAEMKEQISAALEDQRVSEGRNSVRSVLWEYGPEGAAKRTLLAGFFAEATKGGRTL